MFQLPFPAHTSLSCLLCPPAPRRAQSKPLTHPLPPMVLTLNALNHMSQSEFTQALGTVFEETPDIAAAAWLHRPFTSLDHLHRVMVEQVRSLSAEQQVALIQRHPDLGSRVHMAQASVSEQTGAGLDQLTPAEYEQFQTLNAAYRERFGFPFIMAVAGYTKTSILTMFEQRLRHSRERELAQALVEIETIALIRLQNWITTPGSQGALPWSDQWRQII